ncbi:MAG: porin family protein [Rickettsiales bacterium]|nr:porin family protein [Rickettsiales bacterium]
MLCVNIGYASGFDDRYFEKTTKDVFRRVYLKFGSSIIRYKPFKGEGGYDKGSPKEVSSYNIGIGYKFTNAIKTDVNLLFNVAEYKSTTDIGYAIVNIKQRIRMISSFINGYYDVALSKYIIPYLTAGVGVGKNKAGDLKWFIKDFGFEESFKGRTVTNLIWNVGIGIKYSLSKDFVLDLGYRYMDLGNISTNDSSALEIRGVKQKMRGYQILGSLIYNF